jgi:uncharacterized membrane-anchored protein
MVAMEPVWRFLHNLEGFEFAAFWIASFTAVTLAGFFLDYIMQRQGFGPYFNSIFVAGGIWLGLYLRFNYLQPVKMHIYDPYLSITAILGVTAAMLVVTAFLRNRFY